MNGLTNNDVARIWAAGREKTANVSTTRALCDVCTRYGISEKTAAGWGPIASGIGQQIAGHGRGIADAARTAFSAGKTTAQAARGLGGAGRLGAIGQGLAHGAQQFLGTSAGRNAAIGTGLAGAGMLAGRLTAPGPQPPTQPQMPGFGR